MATPAVQTRERAIQLVQVVRVRPIVDDENDGPHVGLAVLSLRLDPLLLLLNELQNALVAPIRPIPGLRAMVPPQLLQDVLLEGLPGGV